MRVVVVGATGNAGTSLLRALADEAQVESVVGVARRLPVARYAKTEFVAADVAKDALAPIFRGADCVVHLAWLIQPARDLDRLWLVNVDGSARVFAAVAEAGVPALVYASSVGVYSPGPKDRVVDESWPTDGIATSYYSRQKAEVERRLDRFEREHPQVRVARLRPGLIFKREAATGQRRLFAGPLLPTFLLRPGRIPAFPDIPNLRFQAVHSYDVGDAYRRLVVSDARGAFNAAADPVLDPPALARLLEARLVAVPAAVARVAVEAAWRLHLQPTPADWLDMALQVPLMDTTRARTELGWEPRHTALDAISDMLNGMREGSGEETPPLSPKTSGPLRLRELLTGIGRRES